MRHRVYGKHLGRSKNERTTLFKGLVESLILHGSIETTQAKAKAIKGLVDKIITQAKSPATKRFVSQFLTHKKTLEKLEQEVLPKLESRVSGYSGITKIGKRLGDGTMMVQISLLFDEKKKETKKVKEAKVTEETKENK